MADEPKAPAESQALETSNSANNRKSYRDYEPEDKFSALAALDINGGNVYRTAIAYGIPESTLRTWRDERTARGGGPSKLEKEKRGNLAAKLEDKIHGVIESITPEVIQKATLSQRGVFVGIGLDKLRILLGQGLDPDPATELCRLLNINRAQLPPSLQLEPGEQIPEGFGPVTELTETSPNSFEPEISPTLEAHSPDCIIDGNELDCSCGAYERNQAKLKADDDKPAN